MVEVMSDNVNKTKVEINTMLDCLLSKDSGCKNCKRCESVDVCCFLMEAVFVSQQLDKRKSISIQ
jgi:hypothetical protein